MFPSTETKLWIMRHRIMVNNTVMLNGNNVHSNMSSKAFLSCTYCSDLYSLGV